MKLLFLGTGAADSRFQEIVGFSDRNKRRCSSLLIDGKILIDCGPFTLSALRELGVDLGDITDVIITHLHSDHCDAESIAELRAHKVAVWASEGSDCLERFSYTPMSFYRENNIGGYSVFSLEANHAANAQHLYIEKDGKSLFYGLDGAWFTNGETEFLKGKKLSAAVLDATVGDYIGDWRLGEHNSIPMIRLMVPSMRVLKILTDDSQVILSHMAVSLHKSASETEKILSADGFIMAYDSMEKEI